MQELIFQCQQKNQNLEGWIFDIVLELIQIFTNVRLTRFLARVIAEL